MSYRLVVIVVIAAFISVFTADSLGQAPPSADAYVTTAMPSANFGSSPILPVQAGTSSYVQLNLDAFPANAKIAKATLRLYVDAVTAPGTFDVYAVNGNWSEHALSANNAPSLGTSATGGQSVAISKASVNQFVLVDITALVQGWLDGTIANNGVALALTSSSGSFAFDSKESSGHHPELEVVLDDSAALAVTPVGGAVAGTAAAASGTTATSHATALGMQSNAPDVYIDNGTVLQTGANFNIDGTGTANVLDAATAYQLGNNPFISMSGWMSQSTGFNAGPSNSGNLNTFVGTFAGQQNTTGAFNTVIGAQANANNQTGDYNTIVGGWAGLNNSGTNNAFYGAYAGYSNTSGVNNMFFGANSGHFNTTGNNNFFLGAGSGYNNTTGSNNTFLGYLSGQNADATANNNLYIGSLGASGESGTTRIGDASSQTAAYIAGVNGATTSSGVPVFIDSTGKLGTGGGSINFSQVSGIVSSPQLSGTYSNAINFSNVGNSFNGAAFTITGNGSAGGMLTASGVNSSVSYSIGGQGVLSIGNTADDTLFVGFGAGAHNTAGQGQYNTFLGDLAGMTNTTGASNTAVGSGALLNNTTGISNSAIGAWALSANTAGGLNTAVGPSALNQNTTGSNNTAVGVSALGSNTTASFNTAAGTGALTSNTTGSNNTAVGNGALYVNTAGQTNTATGASALGANTTGSGNTAEGSYSLVGNTTGSWNAGGGNLALFSNTSGQLNTAFGNTAMYYNTTGSGNTAMGAGAGPDQNSTNLNNSTAVGANAVVSASNALVLGCISGVNNCPAAVNVGIGTATPAFMLDVHGTGNFTGPVTFSAGQTFPFSQLTGTLGNSQFGGTYSSAVTLSSNGNSFSGNGAGLVGIPFASLVGTLTSPQLSGTYGNAVTLNNTSNTITGSFNGNGAGLTGLQFAQLGGTLQSPQLGGTYSNAVTLSNSSNVFAGNGAGLTGVLPGPGAPFYIWNNASTTPQGGASFNIDGNGTVGGTLNANVIIAKQISASGAAVLPVNHARSSFTISANEIDSFTLNWAFAYADTNYTVTCTPKVDSSAHAGFYVFNVSATSVSSVSVDVASNVFYPGDYPFQVTIDCMAIHD